jgi:1-acyl-sn-glycerol-3-phosphate acyltransferase
VSGRGSSHMSSTAFRHYAETLLNLYGLLQRAGFSGLMRRLYRIEVIGGEHIPAEGACILAANHESVVDPFILGVATAREIRYMSKAELFRNRAVAATMRSLGAFPVERGGGDRVAFGEASELLHAGEILGIFPQGTSKQRIERRWHRGAARLALVTGAPIVPVRMTGTRAFPLRSRVRIFVGRPIVVEQARPSVAAAKSLTTKIEEAVLAA